ncbi:hypothetical protein PRIPAC_74615 [Pristionchus pacificus]|uniref:Uncharacterized protein n=1 Tax=Pristionchus pacificus TaxID=54126 RepID=A0A2A6BFW8_PRIPA|nr:hypothetical protein PRIPAC_74615 [Pristionchus pacificus]|eukprot:PDM64701.1 hypothetical protein PRIPAC_52957 [Pristionchus pacificus]
MDEAATLSVVMGNKREEEEEGKEGGCKLKRTPTMAKRPSVIDLRRGRITEKVGETTAADQFPNKTQKNVDLSKSVIFPLILPVDDKRRTLDRLVARVEAQRKNRIDLDGYVKQLQTTRNTLNQSRTVHAPELRDLNDRLAKIAVTRNALKKETNGAEDTLKEEDLGRKKMMDAIAVAENTLEKLEKKLGANADSISVIVRETSEQEEMNANVQKTMEEDIRTVKQLEAYLKKTMDATFNEQRTLDDFRLGMGDEKREIEGMKRRIKEDKAKDRALSQQLDANLQNAKKSEEMLERQNSTIMKTTESELRELLETTKRMHSELKKNVNDAEDKWVQLQDELSSLETTLANSKANEKVEEAKQRRYETKIEILKLEPAPTMYTTYETIVKGQAKKKKKGIENGEMTERLKITRKLKNQLDAVKEEEEEKSTVLEDESVYPDGIFSGTEEESEEKEEEEERAAKKKRSKSEAPSDGKGSKKKRKSSVDGNEDAKRIRDREREAAAVIDRESNQIETEADRLHRENVQIEERIGRLTEEVHKLQYEKVTLREHIAEVEKKMDEAEKRREEAEKKGKKKTKKKSEESSLDVVRLQQERRDLELQRNELKALLAEFKKESIRLNHAYKTMRSWKEHADFEANRRLVDEVRTWRSTVNQAEVDLEALAHLVKEARAVNGAARRDLSLVKPYEEEHEMFIQLRDRARYLTRKLTEKRPLGKADIATATFELNNIDLLDDNSTDTIEMCGVKVSMHTVPLLDNNDTKNIFLWFEFESPTRNNATISCRIQKIDYRSRLNRGVTIKVDMKFVRDFREDTINFNSGEKFAKVKVEEKIFKVNVSYISAWSEFFPTYFCS